MTLDAKARVREHVRNIQSTAVSGAAPAVRPEPAHHFQLPPQVLPTSLPALDNQLESSQVKNGLDYS